MTILLRLDPTHPAVWRSPTSLQFGLDAVAVIDDPLPWQERVLAQLEEGVSESALGALAAALGVPPAEVQGFISRVEAALYPRVSPAPAAPQVRVSAGVGVTRALAEAIGGALAAAGFAPSVWRSDGDMSARAPVILVAHHVLDPQRAIELQREDTPHLPVVFGGAKAVVGPFIRPGHTACMSCIYAGAREIDPLWPVLAAQLVARAPGDVTPRLADEAGGVAARLMRVATDHPYADPQSVTIHAVSSRRERTTHPLRAECGCQSPPESGRHFATTVPAPPTTTGRAFARRA